MYISYKQGHYPINHNKTIKIRKLTLMHCYHLIFRSHSIFTSRPNNVLYSKRIECRITPCLFLITSFHSPSMRNRSSASVWLSRPWNFLRLDKPVILWNIFFVGIVCCFLMILCKLWIFIWQEYHRHYIMSSLRSLLGGTQFSFWPITGDVHLDYLIKMVPAMFLYCEITHFPVW